MTSYGLRFAAKLRRNFRQAKMEPQQPQQQQQRSMEDEYLTIYDHGSEVTPDELEEIHKETSRYLALGQRLKDQQAKALPFMRSREIKNHRGCVGGFNMDDPGTGKTMLFTTLIAMDACTLSQQSEWWRTATLVVVPSLEVAQVWHNEMETRIDKGYQLPVFIYHGQSRHSRLSRFVENLASFRPSVVLTTYGTLGSEYVRVTKGVSPTQLTPDFLANASFLFRKFRRIVLDEAHRSRNANTRTAKAVLVMQADVKWAISGSPIFNSLDDIMTLLRFLGVRPYCDGNAEFKAEITSIARKDRTEALRRLHAILKPITIRRNSDALGLPPMDYKEVTLDATILEKAFYQALKSYCGARVEDMLKMIEQKRAEMASSGRSVGSGKTGAPLGILTLITYMREAACHPGLVINSMKRLEDIRGESNALVAGSLTKDQMVAIIERLKNLSTAEGREDDCCICMDDVADQVAVPCMHACCHQCWQRMQRHAHTRCPMCRQPYDSIEKIDQLRKKMEVKLGIVPPTTTSDDQTWNTSSKLEYLISKIQKYIGTEKIAVVSQWVRVLDLVNDTLCERGIVTNVDETVIRMQGDVRQTQRIQNIKRFQTDPNARLCLLSLRSSSEGITLTAATRVYVVDPWWNPASDYQAIFRFHRIGQNRQVRVRAIYIKDTVEDQMRIIRAAKGSIACATMGDGTPPEEIDWCKEAKLIFNLDDGGDATKKRTPPPTCALPGYVGTSVKRGFDSSYRNRVAQESMDLENEKNRKRKAPATRGGGAKRKKLEDERRQKVELSQKALLEIMGDLLPD